MQGTLTVAEATAIFALDERRVRKEIESQVVSDAGSPPRFELPAVVYLLAASRLGFELGVPDRKSLYARIRDALTEQPRLHTLALSSIIELKLGDLLSEVERKVAQFDAWKSKLSTRADVLGGEPTFPKTRVAVRQVGGMLLEGADPAEVREDFPFLKDDDIELAKLYTLAHPRVGRPRARRFTGSHAD